MRKAAKITLIATACAVLAFSLWVGAWYFGIGMAKAYENESQFTADLGALALVAKPISEAFGQLEDEGFACKRLGCYRSGHMRGVTCSQDQFVSLYQDGQGNVSSFSVELSVVCL